MGFLEAHLVEILFGLVSAGLLGFCKYLHSQLKYFKELTREKSNDELIQTIQEELEPIIEELSRLNKRIDTIENKECDDIGIIVESYKFRLIQLCKKYLRQGYMTETQYEQLSEFYKVYNSLGGNGQAQEYHEKVLELPIKSNPVQE